VLFGQIDSSLGTVVDMAAIVPQRLLSGQIGHKIHHYHYASYLVPIMPTALNLRPTSALVLHYERILHTK
jgi:hypothetical protein